MVKAEQIDEGIIRFIKEDCPYFYSATLLLGAEGNILFDTLLGPQDMEPVRDVLDREDPGKPLFIILSHSHWDHVYGTKAFPGVPVIAHTLCGKYMENEGRQVLQDFQREGRFTGVELVRPNIVFNGFLTLFSGENRVEVLHTPGHTADSVSLYIPAKGVLVAGDTVEDPLPMLEWTGHTTDFLSTLDNLLGLPVRTVIPSHGSVSGRGLIIQNRRYVSNLLTKVAEYKGSGKKPAELMKLPTSKFTGPEVQADAKGYRESHLENLRKVWEEIS